MDEAATAVQDFSTDAKHTQMKISIVDPQELAVSFQALKVVVGLTQSGKVSMTSDVAAACLLNWALASQSTQKLAAHIPGLARQLEHPLLTGVHYFRRVSVQDAPTLVTFHSLVEEHNHAYCC